MNIFSDVLSDRIEKIRSEGLYRQTRQAEEAGGTILSENGKSLLNFGSNDYLSLALEPRVKEAAAKATHDYGAGAGASRLLCGTLEPHQQLEEDLSDFKATEAALTFSSGYAVALGVIPALMGKNDVIVLDKLAHACLVDGARLSQAQLRVYNHNDLNSLEEKLHWARNRPSLTGKTPRVLIVTESVFSMDGDVAPLKQIVDLKEKYGAWLLVDEAHATGLYGNQRRGIIEFLGLTDHVEVQMGTLSKALGSSGGYICGCRALIDYLINKARSFIFSTAPNPGAVAAASAAIQIVRSPEGEFLCNKLWKNVDDFYRALQHPFGSVCDKNPHFILSAIIPLIVGDETVAIDLARNLREQGYFIPAVRYPAVAKKTARLRLTMSARYSIDQISALVSTLCKLNISGRFRPNS